jgi:hypothetical protein
MTTRSTLVPIREVGMSSFAPKPRFVALGLEPSLPPVTIR